MATSDMKIAVIGAGPAGCMLARLLHLASIPVTIFESEASLDFRSQGGSLDLHTKTGLAAIKKAGLYDEFLKYARFDGEAITIADKNLLKYICVRASKKGASRGRPEIDRAKLRLLLLESLPEGCIRWGKKLRRVDDDLRLHFDDSIEDGFNFIVGADGAWSKVRPLLSSATPQYAGMSGYISSIPDAEETTPELHALVDRGSLFSSSDGKAISAQQLGDGSLQVYCWATGEEKPAAKLSASEAAATKLRIHDEFHDWHPSLVDFILHSDESSFTSRSLYMLPIAHSWNHRRGVTLIGDAAHLMGTNILEQTPFAGVGVNLAFQDAMSLADAFMKANSSREDGKELDRYVELFEADMFDRATKAQQQTHDMMVARFFTPGAPRSSIEKFVLTSASNEVPRAAYPLLAGLVYTYFFIFKRFH